jgi:c-di-GMP-binding flagellar brake protein YcgR
MGLPIAHADKRQFPRIKAPIYYKASRFRWGRQQVIDASLDGCRIYSDTAFRIDQEIEIELFLPDETSIRCSASVVWIAALAEDAPAKYDIGLRLLELSKEKRARLERVLFDATQDIGG